MHVYRTTNHIFERQNTMTHTHAHLRRNKRNRDFAALAVGDAFTRANDSKFYVKIAVVSTGHPTGYYTFFNAVRFETGELAYIDGAQPVVVAKDVEIIARF